MHASKYAGGENPPTKELPTGKTQVQQQIPHKWKKRKHQSIQTRRSKRRHHGDPQNSYHANSPYEDS